MQIIDLPGDNEKLNEFYQKQGYVIVGIANGLGKPDIIMAKQLGE